MTSKDLQNKLDALKLETKEHEKQLRKEIAKAKRQERAQLDKEIAKIAREVFGNHATADEYRQIFLTAQNAVKKRA